MEKKRIVLATDLKMYYDIMKLVVKGWRTIYPEYTISLAIILNNEQPTLLYSINSIKFYMDEFEGMIDEIGLFPEVENIPINNQIILAKYYMCSKYLEEDCIIGKSTIVPLSCINTTSFDTENLTVNCFSIKGLTSILTQYLSTKGNLIKKIINPYDLFYINYLNSFIDVEKKLFSEEILIEELLLEHEEIKIKCISDIFDSTFITRIVEEEDLQKKRYSEIHFSLPIKYNKVKLIKEYLDNFKGESIIE